MCAHGNLNSHWSIQFVIDGAGWPIENGPLFCVVWSVLELREDVHTLREHVLAQCEDVLAQCEHIMMIQNVRAHFLSSCCAHTARGRAHTARGRAHVA